MIDAIIDSLTSCLRSSPNAGDLVCLSLVYMLNIKPPSPCGSSWQARGHIEDHESSWEGTDMPVAVVTDKPQRFELKTLPKDDSLPSPAGDAGFVVLKRLSHGDKLTRRGFTSKMTVKAKRGQKDVESELQAFNEKTDLFDFA